MTQYSVTGMSCAACSARVEKAVSAVPGVTSCAVSLLTNSMGVDGTAAPADIVRAVENAGYGASLKGAKGAAPAAAADELADHETPKLKKRLISSVAVLLVLMYFSMGHMWGAPMPRWLHHNSVGMGLIQLLLAGIVLDTKNFTMRTGGRTFEAAAFLRRAGADTSDVQRLFQSDLAGMVERYDIIRHAELVHGDIAVAAVEKEIDRVTAAKAADELLTLSGIHASVVLYKHGTGVNLSARSLGEINVQFIMEKLGGGGNSTTAGGQVADASVDEVRERLLAAIDEYMEE